MNKKIVFIVPLVSYHRLSDIFKKNDIEVYSLFPREIFNQKQWLKNLGKDYLTESYLQREWPNVFIYDKVASAQNYLQPLSPDFIFYGCDNFIKEADELAHCICPHAANPTATSAARENKAKANTLLKKYFFRTPEEKIVPESAIRKKVTEILKFPLVVKPVTYTGLSAGVRVCSSNEELKEYLDSNDRECSLQEIIWDKESSDFQISYSVDGFAVQGRFYFISLQKTYKKLIDGKFIYSHAVQLDSLSSFSKVLFNKVETILKILQLYNGFFHPEFIFDADGEIVLIELNPRLAGGNGLIDKMIEFSLGQGIIQTFIDVVYYKKKLNLERFRPSMWLWFSKLTDEQLVEIKKLDSFIDMTDIYAGSMNKIVLLGHADLKKVEADFLKLNQFQFN